jgi:hypothetical protein
MFLSAVSVLVVAQSSSEVPEGLKDYSVYHIISRHCILRVTLKPNSRTEQLDKLTVLHCAFDTKGKKANSRAGKLDKRAFLL